MIVVLMGVSGSGKTTVGELLAQTTGAAFADADDYHPAVNKAKMAAGHPLDDADREPWLETLNGVLRGWFVAGASGILACSALKVTYRETLGRGMPPGALHFILLEGSPELIAARLAGRRHEYMNPSLLTSQLKTLERPREDEAFSVSVDQTPAEMVTEIVAHVELRRK